MTLKAKEQIVVEVEFTCPRTRVSEAMFEEGILQTVTEAVMRETAIDVVDVRKLGWKDSSWARSDFPYQFEIDDKVVEIWCNGEWSVFNLSDCKPNHDVQDDSDTRWSTILETAIAGGDDFASFLHYFKRMP